MRTKESLGGGDGDGGGDGGGFEREVDGPAVVDLSLWDVDDTGFDVDGRVVGPPR